MVVRPRHPDELHAILDVAQETGAPVTMRGAGTSIAGNAVGTGIVVDTLKHLNQVVSIDPEARTAVVQPGVVHADLQRAAAPYGLRFGPDPSTHTRCTIGGMIGNNACGSRALGYGRTVDNVVALDVAYGPGAGDVAGRSRRLVDQHLGARADHASAGSRRQVSGYSLEHLLPENGRNLDRFLVGSEGTLAVVARRDRPAGRGRARPAPGGARLPVDGRGRRRRPGPARGHRRPMIACEGLDSRIVDLVAPRARPCPSCRAARAGCSSRSPATAPEAGAAGGRRGRARSGTGWSTTAAEAAALWRIREDGAGLAALSLGRPAYSGWEDAAVPPERLGAWLRDFDELLREHGLDGVPYGHFGDGCVHVRIDFPFREADGGRVFRDFLTACALKLREHGGSLSGEHGDGRARSELLPLMYDEESLALFGAVKAICDPGTCSTPATSSTRRRSTPTCAPPGRGSASTRRSASSTTTARWATRCTAAPASASAWRRRPTA